MSDRFPAWAHIGLFLIASVYFLDWASGFLIPITAAFLGFLIALPIEHNARRLGIPSAITAAGITLCIAATIVAIFAALAAPVSNLVDDLPHMVAKFRYDIGSMGGEALERVQEAAEAAGEAMSTGDNDRVRVEVVEQTSVLADLMRSTPWLGGQIALTLILMFFLIASGDTFVKKLVTATPGFRNKRRSVEIIQQLTSRLGAYLGGITVINMGLGVAIGLAMWALGVPNALMFGLIAFAFNFVPFLGGLAGASLAGIVSYSASGELWDAFVVFGTYIALTSIEGQFITPYLISNQLKLNPTVVFITVTFFAWIWSVIGMVVAVPLLIVFKIIFEQFESTRTIGLFLGAETPTLPAEAEA